jgi:hypothetical protein
MRLIRTKKQRFINKTIDFRGSNPPIARFEVTPYAQELILTAH